LSLAAIRVMGPVACCDLMTAFKGSSQRSSSISLVTEKLELDSWTGHSKNVFFLLTKFIYRRKIYWWRDENLYQ